MRTPLAMCGAPYDWGGNDSLEHFDDKIKRGGAGIGLETASAP
jgi:hypothetical protein